MTEDQQLSIARFALIIGGLSMIGPFSVDTYLPAFPAIGTNLGASPIQVQQTITAFLLMFTLMMPWYGPVSDAFGRRRIILAGLALYGLASLLCAFAPNIEILWIGRALQGGAAGAGIVVGRAVIRDLFDGTAAQQLMAAVAVIFAIGPAIAPIIGGWIYVAFNWQGIFLFLVLFAALLFAACWHFLPETLPQEKRHHLSVGNLWHGYKSVFSSREFVHLSVAMAASFNGFFIYVLSSPVFLIEHLKVSPQAFAWLFVPTVLGMMIGGAVNGRLAGRLTPQRTIALGFAIMLVATIANLVLNYCLEPRLPWPLIPVVIYCIGMSLAMPCLQLLALDLFPERRGMASSCQALLQSAPNVVVAGLIAPLLWGTTLSLALGMACFSGIALLAFIFSEAGQGWCKS